MIVPHKYNAKYQEKYRQVKYEYYLTRGLPIPPEYMPKDQQTDAAKVGAVVSGNEGKRTFEPQIAMKIGEKDASGERSAMTTTTVDERPEPLSGRERMIKCIILSSLMSTDFSYLSGAAKIREQQDLGTGRPFQEGRRSKFIMDEVVMVGKIDLNGVHSKAAE